MRKGYTSRFQEYWHARSMRSNEKEYSLSIRACVRGGVMRRHSKKRQASACYRLRGKKQPYIVVIIGIYDSFALLKVSIPG